ncbi:4-diphosphocytidyl-2-C-methyl-D-erythritol kinase [Thermosyntropha lipolytica DSM 11003]|uniref:4-diphosphocytidyl-2-C-methyl-D-erythritol kinase n=1 Tax=Thermosyntropha lipolytica DSM 11003 TaxID=1123382 RepID=A0A1M5JQ65_9FIRM|nr:4-(cytidine 5'-diphospho)-2-C-methyl-D-erythritol kinase [Thermosyntropha lipolytica]SHG42722.1 4-diphosphocytidyl-2-C-methyl-D-erythritol kinase [Thermosyntropha lipolytica DSM 11003]
MAEHIYIEAPAKVNLFLDIKGKRDDGYHEIQTVMHLIDLKDEIRISLRDEGIRVRCSEPFIPQGSENLAYKAAAIFSEKCGIRKGVEIYIDKKIPAGAGLGGGSSDAAAVLKGLNNLLACNVPHEELALWAAEIGSDVPFFIWERTALAEGRGELISPLKRENLLHMLLVKPDFSVSTPEAYRNFKKEEVKMSRDLKAFLAAWENYDIISIAENMINVLEMPVIKLYPEIAGIKDDLKRAGALNALMSGSGSAVFGIFREEKEALRAYSFLQGKYPLVKVVTSYIRGDE